MSYLREPSGSRKFFMLFRVLFRKIPRFFEKIFLFFANFSRFFRAIPPLTAFFPLAIRRALAYTEYKAFFVEILSVANSACCFAALIFCME